MPIRALKFADPESRRQALKEYTDRASDGRGEVLNFYKDLYSRPEVREKIMNFLPEYEYEAMKPVVGTLNRVLGSLAEPENINRRDALGYLPVGGEASLIMENPDLNYTDLQDRELLADLLINRYLSPTALMNQGRLGGNNDDFTGGYVQPGTSKTLGTRAQPFMMGMQRQQQKQVQDIQVDNALDGEVDVAIDRPGQTMKVIKYKPDGTPYRTPEGYAVQEEYSLDNNQDFADYIDNRIAVKKEYRMPTTVHEASHAFDRGDMLSPIAQMEFMESLAKVDPSRPSHFSITQRPVHEVMGPRYAAWEQYLGNPTEVKARLNEIRYVAATQGLDPMNIPAEFVKNPRGFSDSMAPYLSNEVQSAADQLLYMYSPEDVMRLLNEVY